MRAIERGLGAIGPVAGLRELADGDGRKAEEAGGVVEGLEPRRETADAADVL